MASLQHREDGLLGGGEDDVTRGLITALVSTVVPIITGFVLGHMGILTREARGLIGKLIISLILPALIIVAIASLDLGSIMWTLVSGIALAKVATMLVITLITVISTRFSGHGFASAGIRSLLGAQSNDFAMGLPILSAIYPTAITQYIYFFALIHFFIVYPIAIFFLEYGTRRAKHSRARISQILVKVATGIVTNPVIVASMVGLALNGIFKGSLPDLVQSPLNLIGGAFGPLALLNLGAAMVGKGRYLKGASLLRAALIVIAKGILMAVLAAIFVKALGDNEVEVAHDGTLVMANMTQAMDQRNAPSMRPVFTPHPLGLTHHHYSGIDGDEGNSTVYDLSIFAFIYGTTPTAPGALPFAQAYGVDVSLAAAVLVLGTISSAPLMFISAKMAEITTISESHLSTFQNLIASAGASTSYISIVVTTVFILLSLASKLYRSSTQRLLLVATTSTLLLAVAQSLCAVNLAEVPSTLRFLFILYFTFSTRFAFVFLGLNLVYRRTPRNPLSRTTLPLALILLLPMLCIGIIFLIHPDQVQHSNASSAALTTNCFQENGNAHFYLAFAVLCICCFGNTFAATKLAQQLRQPQEEGENAEGSAINSRKPYLVSSPNEGETIGTPSFIESSSGGESSLASDDDSADSGDGDDSGDEYVEVEDADSYFHGSGAKKGVYIRDYSQGLLGANVQRKHGSSAGAINRYDERGNVINTSAEDQPGSHTQRTQVLGSSSGKHRWGANEGDNGDNEGDGDDSDQEGDAAPLLGSAKATLFAPEARVYSSIPSLTNDTASDVPLLMKRRHHGSHEQNGRSRKPKKSKKKKKRGNTTMGVLHTPGPSLLDDKGRTAVAPPLSSAVNLGNERGSLLSVGTVNNRSAILSTSSFTLADLIEPTPENFVLSNDSGRSATLMGSLFRIRLISLLILQLFSCGLGIIVSLWQLLRAENSGIYFEILFLDDIILRGQGLLLFLAVGTTPHLFSPIGKALKFIRSGIRKMVYSTENMYELAYQEDEIQHLLEHADLCEALLQARDELVGTRAYRLRSYDGVLVGKELVDFLIRNGDVEDVAAAMRVGRSLVANGILSHVTQEHHFHNKKYFYTWHQDKFEAVYPHFYNYDSRTASSLPAEPSGDPADIHTQRVVVVDEEGDSAPTNMVVNGHNSLHQRQQQRMGRQGKEVVVSRVAKRW